MKTIQTTFPAVHGEPVLSLSKRPTRSLRQVESNHTPTGPNLPALLLQPNNPLALMLFGHGAGTPMRAHLMEQMALALARHRIATFRYDYPYSHRLETGYREDLIDPLEVLLQTTRAAIQAAQDLELDLPLFLGGRSMSGQVMSLLLAQEPLPHVRGLICYVYPTRWRVLLRDSFAHLPHVPVPTLFIQGARDPEYSDLTQLQSLIDQPRSQPVPGEPVRRPRSTVSSRPPVRGEPARSLSKGRVEPPGNSTNPHATLHVIPGANHAFNLPPQSPKTQHHAIQEAAAVTTTWIHQQLEAPTARSW